jgi:O-methyltransferase involved in polyketide biosynthesis
MTHSGPVPPTAEVPPRAKGASGELEPDPADDEPVDPRDKANLTQHLDRATPARIYDYLLGGKDNFAVDRQAAHALIALLGDDAVRVAALENRAFVRRVVRWMTQQGIDQFVDLGAGLPTQDNVHEVAQEVNPGVRVVYVDHDPIVLAHARALLTDSPGIGAITADLRQPGAVFAHPTIRQLIDPSRPVGLLMFAVLHFVPEDERPGDMVRDYHRRLAPGSMIGFSHVTRDGFAPELVAQATAVYRRSTSVLAPRSRADLATLLAGLDLVEPGLVPAWAWRPESPEQPSANVTYGAVARIG